MHMCFFGLLSECSVMWSRPWRWWCFETGRIPGTSQVSVADGNTNHRHTKPSRRPGARHSPVKTGMNDKTSPSPKTRRHGIVLSRLALSQANGPGLHELPARPPGHKTIPALNPSSEGCHMLVFERHRAPLPSPQKQKQNKITRTQSPIPNPHPTRPSPPKPSIIPAAQQRKKARPPFRGLTVQGHTGRQHRMDVDVSPAPPAEAGYPTIQG